MSYLLRKVSLHKWEPNRARRPNNFTADAITGCTRTTDNTLSVWYSDTTDFSAESVEKIVVALATTMNQPETIDLVWLNNTWLVQRGVELTISPANTKYKSINNKHRDLSSLDHEKLAIVGEHIVGQIGDQSARKRFLKSDLIDLVAKWSLQDGEFKADELNPKWHEPLRKAIEKISSN